MVLAELGEQISGALRRLHTATVVDEQVVQECVMAVCRALLQADVHVRVVQQFKASVTAGINNRLASHSQASSSSSSSSSSASQKTASGGKGTAGQSAAGAGPSGPSVKFDVVTGATTEASGTGASKDSFREINTRAAAVGVNSRKIIQKCVISEIVAMLTPARQPYVPRKGATNVIMFVGLQGSGKTTTCTKYAHYYQRKGWRVALVCADTFRAGAFDQLKQNATKVRIPFYGSYTEADPVKIAEEGVEQFRREKYDMIIVDTSGRHKQEAALFDEMKQVAEAVDPDDVVFVMDSHIGQACFDQAQAFSDSVDVGSVIVTKLDGHAKGGGALSAVAATGAPIIFLGSGEHFDDFEAFEANSFVSRLLGLGDVGGLFSTLKEMVSVEKQQELMDRLSKGRFTLEDMGEQFRNVLKMGPISKVISMVPGIGSNLISKNQEQAGVMRIKRFLCIMDSMTDEELKCEKQFTDSRIVRVAQGSGTTLEEVKLLLEQHKQFSKMVGKMGKIGLTKESALQNMMRNPQQMMSKVQNMLDPRILKQMGGAGNMVNLLRELQSNEGMEGMQEMMKQMGMGGGFRGFGGGRR
ncbi:signal recognition particle SRP54 protein [Toxoplasma gondii ME49]|uniref:signal-recognition-particle GTPase n=7 Tax=Toxoplasma gondii TaxID=5811 RepID=B6K8Z8_TOXGV|nr:signal recognition particle SRP54 protein [Toxoplasma gondii ME49]EPT25956.1 signal recognition particle SRP54 protein [Toxoplasma gondii ME49]ESS35099.1 signal recognition particle SRP54 protein [Toxoplasma gondii VEG]CEL77552.1 TPA: signal recognition particle 54 kda protein,putative [Toxoplasma gondii VEG]|eukprot:XP_002364522.1 signal recognition particle SRP54 protein [Toxoplasma gondii ME49]